MVYLLLHFKFLCFIHIFKFFVMNIFVARLNYDTREDDLRAAFEGYGSVDSVKIIMDKFTGRSKGFGFVEMPNEEEGRAAITNLNDSELDGRNIVVKEAQAREERSDRRSGGGGWGGGRDRGGDRDRRRY
jgi:RNA recognition motif-containing protein